MPVLNKNVCMWESVQKCGEAFNVEWGGVTEDAYKLYPSEHDLTSKYDSFAEEKKKNTIYRYDYWWPEGSAGCHQSLLSSGGRIKIPHRREISSLLIYVADRHLELVVLCPKLTASGMRAL